MLEALRIACKTIAGLAVVGGVLVILSLVLFMWFFSNGGSQGQLWNWGWTLLVPGSALSILAAILNQLSGKTTRIS